MKNRSCFLVSLLTGGISFIAGVSFGYIYGKKIEHDRTNSCGILLLDQSEKDEPIKMFLEVTDLKALEISKRVIFEVERQNYITQK